jgi:hypothetical protein
LFSKSDAAWEWSYAIAVLEQGRGRPAEAGLTPITKPRGSLASRCRKAIAPLFRSNFADCFFAEILAVAAPQFVAGVNARIGARQDPAPAAVRRRAAEMLPR